MRPGRFHGDLAGGTEGEVLPRLDVLWHYECVVSPRSPAESPVSDTAKLHAGLLSPRSPAALLSPSSPSPSLQSEGSPISPRSPDASAVTRPAVDASWGSSPSCVAIDTTSIKPRFYNDQHHGALQRVFSTFDEDGDGYVSVGELCCMFEKLGIPKSQDSIQSLVASSPKHHGVSSHVDEEEFLVLYDSVCSYVDKLDAASSSSDDTDADVDQDLRAAFHVFDLDGNGFISPEELQCVLCSLGFSEACQLDACVDMISRVDQNGDGHVDFWEFKKLMGLASPTMILSC